MKVSLYTITLNGGYYRGPAVPLMDIFPLAKKWGYDGIEIEGKRPHGSPLDLGKAERDAIKKAAADNGLELPCVAAYNDYSSPVEEHRQTQLINTREMIRFAKDIGSPIVRVFSAWAGVTMRDGVITYDIARHNHQTRFVGVTALEQWHYVRDCLKEAANIAEGEGVTLALQNHMIIINKYQDMLDFIQEIDSPALKACLDVPLMVEHTEAYYREALGKVGSLQVYTHFGGRFLRQDDGTVIRDPKFTGRTNDELFYKLQKELCGFTGHNGYELCSPTLTGHDHEGQEHAMLQAELACAYMKQIAAKL